jgi:hypothetical protein
MDTKFEFVELGSVSVETKGGGPGVIDPNPHVHPFTFAEF